jgi:hypothetical protein
MMKTSELVREKMNRNIETARILTLLKYIWFTWMKLSSYFNYVRNVGPLLKTLTRDIVAVPCPLLRSAKIITNMPGNRSLILGNNLWAT